MPDLTFHIHTIGCKTNLCESDNISRQLIDCGYSQVSVEERPGIIIINTCTVTSSADKKVRQYIRRARSLNPGSEIIVTGCGTVFNSEALASTGASILIPNEKKEKIPEIIKTGPDVYLKKMHALASPVSVKPDADVNTCRQKENAGYSYSHSRALIKIQDGCEQDCSYCIVPFVRGPYKSTPVQEVLEKVNYFASKGYEEVVFSGIHIGRYGADIKNRLIEENEDRKDSVKISLANLLRNTLENTSIKRIRLSSIEINEIGKDLIDAIKSGGARIAPHLHIPLQSGSEKILKAMRRKYSYSYFRKITAKLKDEIPGLALTTDIIAGFPGETDKDFEDTLTALQDTGFTKIHVFRYSRRKHTEAWKMDAQIDENIKYKRSKKAREISEKLRNDYIYDFINKRLKVVCEAYDSKNGIAYGTSENYLKVYFKMKEKDYNFKKCSILDIEAVKTYLDGLFGNEIK